ncbi:MAG: hypothetical protein NC182_01720 [Prevotella sp.]|nr:hypothetical protein [Staphylococcus sp.]MCM1349901.1 hypothetical protein [Prevotella sp.]
MLALSIISTVLLGLIILMVTFAIDDVRELWAVLIADLIFVFVIITIWILYVNIK